mmetsp:Transcript_13336/g.25311  ORF Transcript_13336/g.25311 Transcript_13336/m.25311 type:complete len:521 (-) Transcript_13336:48-1610(-)|eukprot:scaffold742_cov165-Amphora_coffeaeformis.AAC.17
MRDPIAKFRSPRSAPSLAFTSPSSLGSNSILSEFSDVQGSESPGGIWAQDGQPIDHGSNQTVASDTSIASVGVNFEQSKFDLNGDEGYADFYDEIRSKSGMRKAVRSLSLDSACPGHLGMIAPRQLADIFSIFHDDEVEEKQNKQQQKSPAISPVYPRAEPHTASTAKTAATIQTSSTFSSSVYKPKKEAKDGGTFDGTDSDAATEVTSNTFSPTSIVYHPMIESLQRECEALKQILATDSAKMLQLQSERRRLQDKLDLSTKEKKELEKKVRGLELEKQASLQRQKKQDQTILHFKAELEKAPRDKTFAGASIHDIEELRLTNELLASQVVHAERELERANSESSNKENVPPPMTPTKTKNDWGVSSTSSEGLRNSRDVLEDISPQALALQLQSLENRLKAMEDDNLSKNTNEQLEHVDKGTQSEEVETTHSEDIHEAEREENLLGWSILLDGVGIEGIEVGLDGALSVATVESDEQTLEAPLESHPGPTQKKDASKCPGGDYFCDCFPSHASADEIGE